MKTYGACRNDSGIVAYDYGPDWIRIRFAHGGIYEYRHAQIGAGHLAALKQLADQGDGLNTYINQHPSVKNGHARALVIERRHPLSPLTPGVIPGLENERECLHRAR